MMIVEKINMFSVFPCIQLSSFQSSVFQNRQMSPLNVYYQFCILNSPNIYHLIIEKECISTLDCEKLVNVGAYRYTDITSGRTTQKKITEKVTRAI